MAVDGIHPGQGDGTSHGGFALVIDGFDLGHSRHLDSLAIHTVFYLVFITWEPPPLNYSKVNFDGSMRNSRGGVGFVIQGPNSRLVAVGRSHLFDIMVLIVEL